MNFLYLDEHVQTNLPLSNLPNRRRAESIASGLLVAAITITFLDLTPSIRVNKVETTLLSSSPEVLSLLGAIESISSIKSLGNQYIYHLIFDRYHTHITHIAGAFLSHSSNARLKLASESPAIFVIISGPFIKKKKAPGFQNWL